MWPPTELCAKQRLVIRRFRTGSETPPVIVVRFSFFATVCVHESKSNEMDGPVGIRFAPWSFRDFAHGYALL